MAGTHPHRYRSPDEDSGRWSSLALRDGDIVVSSRSKHGTTWVQTICALLVHQCADLPAPLAQLSPWLDWLVEPLDTVVARLDAQPHRRVVKTHTPLDGIPVDPRVTYVVVARHPLDAAVSLYHQSANIHRARLEQLTGRPVGSDDPRPPLREWLVSWIASSADPRHRLDSLPGVLWHLGDAWRRRHAPNVVLVHYADLAADRATEMRRLARRLGIDVDADRWPTLVEAAGFAAMRRRADRLVPDPAGVLRDRDRFFRRGTSGAGRALLDTTQYARYVERAAALAPPDLLAWLHREDPADPADGPRRPAGSVGA
ncbi:MAG TPA: sulfotransferase domain-containing protein [Acidimicrobiales bacterium]